MYINFKKMNNYNVINFLKNNFFTLIKKVTIIFNKK